jgi:predicted esterase
VITTLLQSLVLGACALAVSPSIAPELAAGAEFAAGPEQAGAKDPAMRADLAWRTRAVEQAWMGTRDAERRSRALPHVEEAVQRFFRFDSPAVGASLGEALAALEGREAVHPLDAVRVHPSRRLVDTTEPGIELVIRWLYGAEPEEPLAVEVRCAGLQLAGPAQVRIGDAAPGARAFLWPDPSSAPEGDLVVEVVLRSGDGEPVRRSLSMARVPRLGERLEALAAPLPEGAPALEARTLKARLKLLGSLAAGSTEETDFPAARLLAEAEAMAKAAAKGQPWFGADARGQHWLSVPVGRRAASVRLLVPSSYDPTRPGPIVVALHGMGGSENMFFDAYGAGLAARLCEERGWLMVAPRVSPLGTSAEAVLDGLEGRLAFDRERVLLLGHSMGAGVGQRLVSKAPGSYRAFVAMGGGGSQRDRGPWVNVPLYATAGERDFGRSGVEALHASLEGSGEADRRLVIEPGTEHLLIVAEALPAAFRWLDGVLDE